MTRPLLPILGWARGYDRAVAGADLLSAAIVTVMLVPQSLAYAMLAGMPPEAGLYASILPLVAYALFGTSRTLAVGPVAVISLMTAAATGQVADPGTAAYAEAAATLALLSGLILVAMSAFRLGFLANFLSHPVIAGFISASGILIAAGQLRHILGAGEGGHTLPETLAGLAAGLSSTNLSTLALGLMSLALLVWTRRHLKPILLRLGITPRLADALAKTGPALAVVGAMAAVAGLSLDRMGVAVVGAVPAALPALALPRFDLDLWRALAGPAALIALVGFVESVSVAQTLAARRRERIEPDRELTALGAANLAAAVSGGFPVTGGFARSVVNFDAGARTPLAGAWTAVFILLATVTLAPLFRYLPQAVLAATIIVAVLGLVDAGAFRRTWAYSKSDFAAMAATAGLVLTAGVEAGILAGVTLSILLFLYRTSRPHYAVVGRVPGSEHFRNVLRHEVETDPAVLVLRVDESLYFANARFLEDTILSEIAQRPEVRDVVLMCPAVNLIDASALESLEMIADRLHSAGVGFHLSEVKGPVMDALRRTHFLDRFRGRIFLSQHDATTALRRKPAT